MDDYNDLKKIERPVWLVVKATRPGDNGDKYRIVFPDGSIIWCYDYCVGNKEFQRSCFNTTYDYSNGLHERTYYQAFSDLEEAIDKMKEYDIFNMHKIIEVIKL